jgi:hypothetical protein
MSGSKRPIVWLIALLPWVTCGCGTSLNDQAPGSQASPALPAPDLTKIDRTIHKEPKYGSKPRYGLLVLGQRAETRIWLVIDDKTLYVDRNGNGDLAEAGEKITAGKSEWPEILEFEAGEIVEADGTTKHSGLRVVQYFANQYGHIVHGVALRDVRGTRAQSVNAEEGMAFADTPKDAPIMHFNGPLTMRVYSLWEHGGIGAKPREFPYEMVPGETNLHVTIGTPGLGKGTFAAIVVEKGFPEGIHPSVEMALRGRGASKTIKLMFDLKDRC